MRPVVPTPMTILLVALFVTSPAAVAKSKCFPRQGNCVVVELNGQAAVKLTKKDRRVLKDHESKPYVDGVRTWIPEPVRGDLRLRADAVADVAAAKWFGSGAQARAAIVPLTEVELDVERSIAAAESVRIGGEAVLTERLELQENRLPPGPYLLRVTVRGSENWDRATVYFRVADD